MEYVICTAQNFWSDTEAQLLMDKFREYQHEIGPMKKFKNKKSMWEKISADILAELGSLKTGAQCENRFKTVRKRKGWSDNLIGDKTENEDMNGDNDSLKRKRFSDGSRRVSGNSRNQSENLLSKSQDIVETVDVDVDVDVRRGVGQVSYSNTACESNDEDDKREKKRFRQTLSTVLLQIHREKEEARERRHQEKMELLKLLLQ